MFGLLSVDKKSLSEANYVDYASHYHSLCNALPKEYGMISRVFLNYNTTFLAMLTSAQMETPTPIEQQKCPVRPFRGVSGVQIQFLPIKFASAVTVYMVKSKLEDDLYDAGEIKHRLAYRFFEKPFKKAQKVLHDYGFSTNLVDERIRVQRQLEKSDSLRLHQICEPTASGLAYLFEYTAKLTNNPENSKALSKLGYNLGKIIYLIDSLVDYQSDLKCEHFNAICVSFSDFPVQVDEAIPDGVRIEVQKAITDSLVSAQAAYQELRLTKYQEMIGNILLDALPSKINRVLDATEKNTQNMIPVKQSFLSMFLQPRFFFADYRGYEECIPDCGCPWE